MGFSDDLKAQKSGSCPRSAPGTLLRDRRPADKAYAAVVGAAGLYLRLNRHDAKMTKALDRLVGE